MHEQFCMLRIFRLFRINAYYDSLSVITEVIVGKKQQLLSSAYADQNHAPGLTDVRLEVCLAATAICST